MLRRREWKEGRRGVIMLPIARFEARSRPRARPREAPPTTCESDCIRVTAHVHAQEGEREREKNRGGRENAQRAEPYVREPLRYVMQVPTWVPDALRLSADSAGARRRGRRGRAPASERTARQPFDSRDRDLVRAFCEIAVWRASAA